MSCLANGGTIPFCDPTGQCTGIEYTITKNTADNIDPYAGGADTTTNQAFQSPANMPAFPGPLQTVQIWAAYNGARDPVTDPGPSMDLTTDVPGLDTVIRAFATPGGGVRSSGGKARSAE